MFAPKQLSAWDGWALIVQCSSSRTGHLCLILTLLLCIAMSIGDESLGIDSYTKIGWPYVGRARAAPWSSIICRKSCGSWGVQGQWALTNAAVSAEAWASTQFLVTKIHFLYQHDRIPSGRFPSTSMVLQASRSAYYQGCLPWRNAGMREACCP